jgi:hypothetical protein
MTPGSNVVLQLNAAAMVARLAEHAEISVTTRCSRCHLSTGADSGEWLSWAATDPQLGSGNPAPVRRNAVDVLSNHDGARKLSIQNLGCANAEQFHPSLLCSWCGLTPADVQQNAGVASFAIARNGDNTVTAIPLLVRLEGPLAVCAVALSYRAPRQLHWTRLLTRTPRSVSLLQQREPTLLCCRRCSSCASTDRPSFRTLLQSAAASRPIWNQVGSRPVCSFNRRALP